VIELDHEVSGYREQVSDLSEKVSHYSERVEDQAKEIERLGATAQKILNNVNHELRLPVGNVMNFAQMLGSGIDKMSAEEVKMISEEVYTNSTRLSTMILNMLDLAMLSAKKIELKKRTINFSELVEERVKMCRGVYLGDKKIDFRLTIEPEILIAVDPNYIRQVVDNIVINSINFSEEGLIEVTVEREDEFVKLTISDEGKGILMAELYDIFTPFKMGSNSESKAQGRGVGLALCKAAIEAHGGSIKAESNGSKGVKFTMLLPFYRILL
jgi:signal transduction histidine kinase